MRQKFLIALLSVLAIATNVEAESRFGYISYSTGNIGDDIQALAAKQFLPTDSVGIDREFVGVFKSSRKVHTIVNGWYMHTKDLCWYLPGVPGPAKFWPPSPSIKPLLVSIHLWSEFIPYAFSPKVVAYMKKYGPVGARDYSTLAELQKRGIPAYFSGCLTLTLKNEVAAGEREDVIYVVDLDDAALEYVKSKTSSRVEWLTHCVEVGRFTNPEERLHYAAQLLDKYKRAKCVVTNRLHAAMPCLGLETPVLLIEQGDDPRFNGLRELIRHCTREELLNGHADFDFETPTQNPQDYLPIRENLQKIVREWVGQKGV